MESELEQYHLNLLGCIYDAGVIGGNYWPIQYVAKKCEWNKIAKNYRIRKNLKKILRYLESLGLVSFHGKTRNPVVSLTSAGVAVARDYLDR